MRSSLAKFQKKTMAIVSYMQKSKNYGTTQVHEFFDKAEKQLAKLAGGGRIHGNDYKPNGAKECARRVRQMSGVNPNITMDQRMSFYMAQKLVK